MALIGGFAPWETVGVGGEKFWARGVVSGDTPQSPSQFDLFSFFMFMQ